MKKVILVCCLILLLASNISAESNSSFFEDRARGWHWYEASDKEDKTQQNKQVKNREEDPSKRMERLKKKIRTSLNKAILEPTEENIASYMKLQDKMMGRSQLFAENWQRVLYRHPELDRSIERPVNQAALPIYYAKEDKRRSEKIKNLGRQYGLIYFYKGECSYCQEFSPVLLDFANRYNLEILSVSLDGKIIKELPNNKVDNGIATNLGIKVVPALIALDTKTQKVIPLAYGFISQSELERRIDLLIDGKGSAVEIDEPESRQRRKEG